MGIATKVIGALLVTVSIAAGSIFAVGTQQPSQAFAQYESVLFVALKRGSEPNAETLLASLEARALWKARALFPFVGEPEAYWSDYVILPPDQSLEEQLETATGLEDIYVAEIRLLEVPSFALGMLRSQHLAGLTKRPPGELPTSAFEVEGRREILPTPEAIEKAQALNADMPVTMVNFLQYFSNDDGTGEEGREAYRRYGEKAFKAVHAVGGQFLFAGRITRVVIPAKSDSMPAEWDDLAAMIYPDSTAILAMEQIPEYRRALGDRDAGLKRTRVIASQAY